MLITPAALVAIFLAPADLSTSEGAYFPLGIFYPCDASSDDFDRRRFSEHFRSMHAPSLWAFSRRDPTVESYRFFWWSFPKKINLISIEVTRTDRGATLRLIERAKNRHSGFGPVVVDRQVQLSEAQWIRIRDLVRATNLWNAPVNVKDHYGFTDGELILIEAVSGGKYHVVCRMGLLATGSYLQLCRQLLIFARSRALPYWDRSRHEDRMSPDYRFYPMETPDVGDVQNLEPEPAAPDTSDFSRWVKARDAVAQGEVHRSPESSQPQN